MGRQRCVKLGDSTSQNNRRIKIKTGATDFPTITEFI